MSIQTIRILTQVNDAHAAAVAWALHRLGLDAAITCLSELAVDGRGISWRETGQVFHLTEEVPDLLWFRRPTRPIHLPGGSIDQPDQLHELANVEETLTLFVEGLEEILPGVRVLNRPSAVRRSANKVLNIQEANNAGLAVPKSIITNSINEGRSFASEMGGKVVYKPLRHSIWKVKPNVYTTARSTVVDKDFLMNIENSYLPFILQEVVHKVAEWRVVYTCGEVVIIEQTREDEFMPVDWRIDARKFSKYKKINPEMGFLDKVRKLARNLNIQTFTADFAVRDDGEPIFLDLNSSGQFLYLEEWSSALPMLSMVTDQLISAPPGTAASLGVSMAAFRDEVDTRRIKPRLQSSDLAHMTTRKAMICGRLE